MEFKDLKQRKKKRFVIITGYLSGESYGLLGPQMAATIINDYSNYEALVLDVTNDDDKQNLKAALDNYFQDQQKIVGFSSLGGRVDLFDFARQLKEKGEITILAGAGLLQACCHYSSPGASADRVPVCSKGKKNSD